MHAWPADLQKRIVQISCVQSNQTSIERALKVVVDLNERVDITPQQVKTIAKMSNGDMSVALNILRTVPKFRDQCTSDEMMGKDLADTNLFHRFGKIMYNKRSKVITQARFLEVLRRLEEKRRSRSGMRAQNLI